MIMGGSQVSLENERARRACKGCGGPVRVQILEGYRAGVPIVHYWCLACADRADETVASSTARPARERLRGNTMLLTGGLALGLIGVLSDHAVQTTPGGLGLLPSIVACAGALGVVIGALLRMELSIVAGTLIFGLAACADLMQPSHAGRVGAVIYGEVVLGMLLVAGGLATRLRTR